MIDAPKTPLRKFLAVLLQLALVSSLALPFAACMNDDDDLGDKIEEGAEEVADEIDDAT